MGVSILALINNFRALANGEEAMVELLQFINVGHAMPAVGRHHDVCEGLVMQFYIECLMTLRTYPSCVRLVRFFLCLSATQLCHFTEMAEGTGVHCLKMRLKLHELIEASQDKAGHASKKLKDGRKHEITD